MRGAEQVNDEREIITIKVGRIFWLMLMVFNALNAWKLYEIKGSLVTFGICTFLAFWCLYKSTR